MKNRVKNLFIAGLMLVSMGLATVVQAEMAWGANKVTKMVTYKSQCDALNGEVIYQVEGKYLCQYTPSDGSIQNNVKISGSSKEAVEKECADKGGKIGPGGIQQVNNGGWVIDCIPVSNSQSGSTDPGGSVDPSDSDGTGTGTSSTEIKQNGEYEYGAGLDHKDEFSTSIIDCNSGANGEGIFCLLNIGLTVLTWGIGIAGTLGIVITGIQYLTARDSVEQMTKAKNRLINIVIGLVVYAVMWGFLNWLIPGGLF